MTALDFVRTTQEWLAAWNAHDLERILTHYAPDAELVSPFVGRLMGGTAGSLQGQAALRDYFERGLRAYPDLRFEGIRVYAGLRSCVLEYHSVNGMRAAETMEFDEAGKIRRVLAHYIAPA